MKKIVCVFILLCLYGGTVFSQNTENLCAGTPLECAVALLKAENDLWQREQELSGIASDLWHSGKKREALEVVNLIDENDNEEKIMLLVDFAENSLKENEIGEAAEVLTKAFEYREDFDGFNEYYIKKLAFNLIAADLEEKIDELLNSYDGEVDKTLSLIEISKASWKKGNYLKTLEMLSEASKYAEQISTEYRKNELKAEIGKQYVEIGELKNGFELLDSVKTCALKDLDVFQPVYAAYLKAGEYDQALGLVNEYQEFTKSETAYHLSEIYFHAGNKTESLKFLGQTSNYEKEIAADKSNNFEYRFLVNVVKLYLKWNEPAPALMSAKAFGDEKAQLFSFIEISEYYRNQAKPAESFKIIELAFEKAKKIKNNDDDSSELIRDDHLAYLADESFNANNFVLAEKIVRAVEKKFYRGGGLAVLVFMNKNYSPKKIWSLLDESRILFQKNDSTFNPLNKIRLWSMLAHGYAHNGKKAQAQAVFAEILDNIADDDRVNDKGKIQHLSSAGYWFEKSELTVDDNIRKSLQKIAVRWIADNPPQEN